MTIITKIRLIHLCIHIRIQLSTNNTYETSFASLAGPISDRVVKPVALKLNGTISKHLPYRMDENVRKIIDS